MKPRLLIVLLLLLVSCSSDNQSAVQIPTYAPTGTPPAYGAEAADRVAIDFLEAWRVGDLDTMHRLTTFATQEATPLETFRAIYTDAQNEMTFVSFTYQINSMFRERENVAVYTYDMVFSTRILGDFTDTNREMHLVIDSQVGEWRVAWSPGDIFTEMGSGAVLRLDSNISNRLNIYDRDGGTLADQNGRAVIVRLIEEEIPDLAACITTLATTFEITELDVQDRLNNIAPSWLADIGIIEPAMYLNMQPALERDCNATFGERSARRYLNGSLAPHVIGYVGYASEAQVPDLIASGFPQDTIVGQSGIELYWDQTLRGQAGGRLTLLSRAGDRLRVLAEAPSQPSQSVWLTIDSDLQQFVINEINEAYVANAEGFARTSNGAAAVVMDVNTGAILAMVSYPTFDANAFVPFPAIGRTAAAEQVLAVQNDARLPQLNRATQGVYPAGSTFKIVDALAVADSGIYTLDQRFGCGGVWERDGIVRDDWLAGGHGTLTLPGAITQSCNPYFYEVGYQMNLVDPYLLPTYARRLGLGSNTGLTDIAESPGLIGDPDWLLQTRGEEWVFAEAVSMAIGQGGVEVTPLQMTRLTALVANGGLLYRPQLVQQAGIFGEAPTYVMEPEITSDTGIDSDVIGMVQGGMCAVTEESYGTANFIFDTSPLQQIGVCGKTGTAQDLTSFDAPPHAWFVAYAPAENPQIAITVMVENAGNGSEVAAPIVREILEYYFFGTAD